MSNRLFALLIFLLIAVFPVMAEEPALLDAEKIGDFSLGQPEKNLKTISCPLNKGKEEMWGADGMYHQTWDYPECGLSFGMSSEKAGGSKTIDSITMATPSTLKTTRGIGIGSTEDEVNKAYSADKDAESSRPHEIFVAGSIYGGVFFDFKDNKVSSIFMGAGAE